MSLITLENVHYFLSNLNFPKTLGYSIFLTNLNEMLTKLFLLSLIILKIS